MARYRRILTSPKTCIYLNNFSEKSSAITSTNFVESRLCIVINRGKSAVTKRCFVIKNLPSEGVPKRHHFMACQINIMQFAKVWCVGNA